MSRHYVTAWVRDKQGRSYVLSETDRGDRVWASASNSAIRFANVTDMLSYFTQYNVGVRSARGMTLLYRKSRGQAFYYWPSLSSGYRTIRANPRRRQLSDEELREMYEEAQSEISSGEAYVISDSGPLGSRLYVSNLGEEFDSMPQAIRAIAADMQRQRYWPGVYYVNDHGNMDVLALRIGKNGRVTYKTVASSF